MSPILTPRTRPLALAALLFCFAFTTACHYAVTHPESGKTYFTKDIKRYKNGGVKFKDGKTGAKITLQDSEVRKISGRDYKTAVRAE